PENEQNSRCRRRPPVPLSGKPRARRRLRAHHEDMSELTIPGVLARAAEEAPDAEAVVDGDVRETYEELRERVRGAGGAFAGCGIAPGGPIRSEGRSAGNE